MAEKIDTSVAIAGFVVLAMVLVVELLLLLQQSPAVQPWLSPLARFAARVMFGHGYPQ